ncbi:MAG TPA: hypothetical protein PLW97_06800 [Synergistaceae bacterium]|nr:hypothetical protein [Synergistaceae bacterium]
MKKNASSPHLQFRENFFEKILSMLFRLHRQGYPSFLVGGAVRDLLLHRPIRDADLLTRAPREILERLYPGGKHIGTTAYPIYLVRIFAEKTGEIAFLDAESLEENLARRDFTVNSLGMNHRGELLGSPEAFRDVRKRLLRWNGSPEKRLRQDPLRALRLCRFGISLEGFRILPGSLEACPPFAKACAALPGERIGREMRLGLQSGGKNFPEFLCRAGLLEHLCPGGNRRKSPEEFFFFSRACSEKRSFSCGTAAFFLDLYDNLSPEEIGKRSFSLLRHWRWPEKEAREVRGLLKMWSSLKKPLSFREGLDLLERFGFPRMEILLELLALDPEKTALLDELQQQLFLWKARLLQASEKGMLLPGKECAEKFAIPPGPLLGELLREKRRKILETPDLSPEELYCWLEERSHKLEKKGNPRKT